MGHPKAIQVTNDQGMGGINPEFPCAPATGGDSRVEEKNKNLGTDEAVHQPNPQHPPQLR
jgi:hypothetical protein